MNTPPQSSEIASTITAILREALRVAAEKIIPGARLFDDLGAESIDVLDIRFRMEHAFALKIEPEDLLASLGEGLDADQVRQRFTVDSLVRYVETRLGRQTRAT